MIRTLTKTERQKRDTAVVAHFRQCLSVPQTAQQFHLCEKVTQDILRENYVPIIQESKFNG